jgi:hypothetical protein
VNDQELQKKDALGISGVQSFEITATTAAKILLIDVPMVLSN